MSDNLKISVITAFSVLLSLVIAGQFELNSPFYAAIAAAVVSQPNNRKVIELGLKRIYGTLVGAAMGLLFFHYLPHNNYIYAVGIFIVVYICSRFLRAPSNMAVIVFMAISVNLCGVSSSFYAVHRIIDTGIGIASTVLVTLCFTFFLDKIEFRKEELEN
ncbi:MAG: FUSC family protein [Lentisphaeria bacterium]|nr:FUSC family protein [Lentisphaeria bacterium]